MEEIQDRKITAVKIFVSALFLLSVLSAVAAEAHPQEVEPFAGTWKWNAKASQFTDQRLTIKNIGSNTYTFDDHYGTPTTVVADGKPQKIPGGDTLALQQVDASTWKTTYTGRIGGSGIYTISKDGQSLTKQQNIVWGDGGREDRETDLRRIGSGSGLAGEWQTTTFDSKSSTKPFVLIFTPGGKRLPQGKLPSRKA